MAIRDIVSYVQLQRALDAMPAKKNTFTSATIDRMKSDGGYEALALYLLVGTWTDGSFAFTINDSPDASVWTAVGTSNPDNLTPDGATGFASITSAPTAVNQKVGYIGSQRYVQVVCTVTGSPATGCQMDLLAVLGNPRNLPTTA